MRSSFNTIISRVTHSRLVWPLAGLGLILLFNLLCGDTFFDLEIRNGHLYGTLVDILNQGSICMLLALGMTLVIATGGIDLSVGSVMAISGAIAALLVTRTTLPFAVVVPIALSAALVAGVWNGVLVSLVGIQPFVATLILMIAGRGIAQLFTDGQIITFTNSAFVFLGNGHILGLPTTATIVMIVFTATVLLTRKTSLGLFIEAIGDNATASRFAGISVRWMKIIVYGFCGLCAGTAGLIATSYIKAADVSRMGEMMELDAIFAVVVGGTALTGGRFTLIGSIVGAVLLQTLTVTMYNFGVPPAIAPVPKAIVIISVCLLQSEEFRRRCKAIPGQVNAVFRHTAA